VSVLIRRITLAALMAALVGGTLALPASSKPGPVAHESKCKKGKKGKHKKKKCKRGHQSGTALPGQATHPTPTQPSSPPVTPALLVNAVAVTDNPVLDGTSTSGQVTISGPAASGGQVVDLQSSDPRVTVPGSVVVTATQTTASFAVNTSVGPPVTSTLTASIGTSSANTQLNVVDTPSVASVSLERQCFTPGSFSSNRVNLDIPAPSDTPVDLSSDSPLSLVVPATVTVPSGSKTAFFGATALGVPTSAATVTATLAPSVATDTASVSLTSPNPVAAGLSLQPNTVTAGSPSTGTVTLDCEAAAGGAVVNLSSSSPDVTVPSTVTVQQDKLTATFPISTAGSASAGDVTITATRGGSQLAVLHVTTLGT
jgi:hypothetical protein